MFSIYFGQTRKFPYFYKIYIPTYIFSVVNWRLQDCEIQIPMDFGLSPGVFHRGVLLKQSDVVKLPCCWDNPDFFRQMQLRDISGEKTGEETEVEKKNIWLDRL